jgi:hypothetical protein
MDNTIKIEEANAIIKSSDFLKNCDFESLRDSLEIVCDKVAQRFKFCNRNGKPRKAFIVNVLAKSPCITCITNELSSPALTNDVDAMYKECHKLAVNVLVEELYQLLTQTGYKVVVSTEAELEYGKADILITITSYGLNLKGNDKELIVEVKTGNSLSLPQLFRYLLDRRNDNIIIWRIRKRQILVFNAQKIKPLLTEFMRMICLRANRLLSSQQIQPCHHNRHLNHQASQEELERMFEEFSEALMETLPYVMKTVLENLGVRLSQCNEKAVCDGEKGVQ